MNYQEIKAKKPIVHNITNYVTVNDLANTILAVGGTPIMADDIAEVREITSISNALVINIGTLNERTIKSMIASAQEAKKRHIPIILDPVGNGASSLRTHTVNKILEEVQPTVIKGNITELLVLLTQTKNTTGVDASTCDEVTEDNKTKTIEQLKTLAKQTNSIIAATGKVDIITDGITVHLVKNGTSTMRQITGTGCMTAGIIGVFLGTTNDYLYATSKAISLMGQAGEIASAKYKGLGSFKVDLLDALSNITDSIIEGNENIETL